MSLIKRILHAPISWYDKTPVGRIINRASNDQSNIDKMLVSYINITLTFI